MARVVFVTPFAGGNVPPTIAIASALAARKHEVQVLGHPQIEEAAVGAGLRFLPFSQARGWSPIVDRPGTASMLSWLRLASDRGIARDLAVELERTPADLVVVDCMVPVALRPARRSGARVVLLLHAFSGYWGRQWRLSSPMGAWQGLTGVHPRRTPADLAVVTTAPDLDVVDASAIPAERVAQTGPVIAGPGTPQRRGPSDPAWDVLVSFSTISYPEQEAALQRTLDAIAMLPVSAVATLASSVAPRSLRFPPNVERRPFVPHTELLPQVRLLVGHGGHGTTMTALAHGVPVLVIAMSSHADQPLVGEAVARAGAGLALPRRASTEQVRRAVNRILADPVFHTKAEWAARSWRDGHGAASAARAISTLVPDGR